jgi:hypothetical protein
MKITAKMLRDAVDRFIAENGEDCPVYYQIFSHHDVRDYDNNGEDDPIIYDRDFCDNVIIGLNDHDHITDEIFDAIGDEIRYQLNLKLKSQN